MQDDYVDGLAFGVIPVYVAKDLSHFYGRGPISEFLVHVTGALWELVGAFFEIIIPGFRDPGVPIKVWTKLD